MDGYLATPNSGSGPAVLVLPAWWGLTPFFKNLCDRLAENGFVAFAPDLYQGKTASTVEEAKNLRSKLNQKTAYAELVGIISELLQADYVTNEKIFLMGFSMGARFALELSVDKPDAVAKVVAFYGNSVVDYSPSKASYLAHFAEKDEWVAQSGVKKLEKALIQANRPFAFYYYPGTGHWFFEDDRHEAYNDDAAKLAWKRTLDFFKA